jgi:hypothetical protein
MGKKNKTAKPKKANITEEESVGEVYYSVTFKNCTITNVQIYQSGKPTPPNCLPGQTCNE